eukprot:4366568-Alexandrium_andersonii.AAC.1
MRSLRARACTRERGTPWPPAPRVSETVARAHRHGAIWDNGGKPAHHASQLGAVACRSEHNVHTCMDEAVRGLLPPPC